MGAKRLNRKGVSAHGGSILFGALAAVCSLLHCSSAWAATTAEVLLQTNTLAGTHEVTYCELGLRIKSMRGDYVIVMKPPSWKVILYSPKKKVYFETTPNLWYGTLGEGVQSTWEDRYKELRIVSNSAGQFQGIKARHIVWFSKIDPMNQKRPDSETLAKKNRLELLSKSAEQWSTENSPYLKQITLVLNRFYHLPIAPGVPLSYTYDGFSGGHHEMLYTKRLKPKECTAADFEAPKGMRQVSKERDVIFNDASNGLLDVLR
jgi:hypothetical protein